MNAKQKGSEAEREVARILRDHGYDARRGLQYQSGQVEADVVGLPGYHIEVKRCEVIRMPEWIRQSMADARPGEKWAVVWRRSREPWRITMDFEAFLEEVQDVRNPGND